MRVVAAVAIIVGSVLLSGCADREAGIGETGPVSVVDSATTEAAASITRILAGPAPSDTTSASTPAGTPSPSPSAGIEEPDPKTTDTLTVWLLPDTPDSLVTAVNKRFAKSYPKAEVRVIRQDWATLSSQLQAKLPLVAETPDVIELANDQTAPYAGEGLLADLSPVRGQLRESEWTKGLAASTQVDGALAAVPLYGSGRVVAYDKVAWRAAGASDSPRTLQEFSESLERVQSGGVQSDYSAFWFPGRYWVGALPWIWSQGGEIAIDEDGWQGAVDSSESQAGLGQLQTIVKKFSRAPADRDETSASQVKAFDEGRASSALMTPWEIASLTKEAGVFALPGVEPGTVAPQYLEGSDLAVSATSPRQGLAVAWLREVLDTEIQKDLARKTGWIPGLAAAVQELKGTPVGDAQAAIAEGGKFTPMSPEWPQVEAQNVLPDMLQKILAPEQSASPSTATSSLLPTAPATVSPSAGVVPGEGATDLPSIDPSELPSLLPSN